MSHTYIYKGYYFIAFALNIASQLYNVPAIIYLMSPFVRTSLDNVIHLIDVRDILYTACTSWSTSKSFSVIQSCNDVKCLCSG